MKLIQAAGLLNIEEVNEDAMAALVENALTFLECGGVLSLDDFKDLNPDQRAAFRQAGRAYATYKAILQADLLISPGIYEEAVSSLDEGKTKQEAGLNRVTASMVDKFSKQSLKG